MDFMYGEELEGHVYEPEDKHFEVIGIFNNLQDVGYIHYYIEGFILYIDRIEIESAYQKRGYSNLLIKEVLKIHPYLKKAIGASVEKSIPYWEKKNAVFSTPVKKGLYQLYPFEFNLNF